MLATKTKVIDLVPHKSLMPKLGQAGYSTTEAISELVDNSIDARFEDVALRVDVIIDPKRGEIEVKDNGRGMDESTFENCLRLAQSSKTGQLGEFGLGLKTSAISIGKAFSVWSTKSSIKDEFYIEYDEDKWSNDSNWQHEMQIAKKEDKTANGTTIRIWKCRKMMPNSLASFVKKELSIRFAPFIENGEVKIFVNGKECSPEPLDLKTDYHEPDGREDFDFLLESGNRVWGWRGLLRKGSDKGDYGFRVFRRGRLIKQYEKIGFNSHPEARQIVGELHLDHIPVTHNKREFIQESVLYQELIQQDGIFWNFMRDIVREARSSIRKTQINQDILDKVDLQKENIVKAINQIPELKEYAFPEMPNNKKGDEGENDGIAELDIEKRDKRDIATLTEEPETEVGSKNRTPKKLQNKRDLFITVRGKRFRLTHDFVDLKNETILKDKIYDNKNGIVVYTNIGFAAFATCKDHVFYALWNIVESIAEVMVETNDRSATEIITIRNSILQKSQSIARDFDDLDKERRNAEKLKKEYDKQALKVKSLEEKQVGISGM